MQRLIDSISQGVPGARCERSSRSGAPSRSVPPVSPAIAVRNREATEPLWDKSQPATRGTVGGRFSQACLGKPTTAVRELSAVEAEGAY